MIEPYSELAPSIFEMTKDTLKQIKSGFISYIEYKSDLKKILTRTDPTNPKLI